MNTYAELVQLQRLKDDEEEKTRRIVPDGGVVTVSIMAMDSMQRALADRMVMDERVRDNQAANQATLDAAQRNADRAAAWADHFSAERKAQVDNSTYGKFCQQLSDDWRNPSNFQVAA